MSASEQREKKNNTRIKIFCFFRDFFFNHFNFHESNVESRRLFVYFDGTRKPVIGRCVQKEEGLWSCFDNCVVVSAADSFFFRFVFSILVFDVALYLLKNTYFWKRCRRFRRKKSNEIKELKSNTKKSYRKKNYRTKGFSLIEFEKKSFFIRARVLVPSLSSWIHPFFALDVTNNYHKEKRNRKKQHSTTHTHEFWNMFCSFRRFDVFF